jgi:hypothetical protein
VIKFLITKIDPLGLVSSSQKLSEGMKKKITAKIGSVYEVVTEIETMTRISFPAYYIDPVLLVSIASESSGEIGILYARTIPAEVNGKISILIQLSAPLVLYASKSILRLVMAHEFLHYLELVSQFSTGKLLSELSPSSFFEETYEDATRAIDPAKVFPRKKKLTKDLRTEFQGGFSNEKLNERCRRSWIEKGLPTVKIRMGANQIRISMGALAKSSFDPEAVKLLTRLDSSK